MLAIVSDADVQMQAARWAAEVRGGRFAPIKSEQPLLAAPYDTYRSAVDVRLFGQFLLIPTGGGEWYHDRASGPYWAEEFNYAPLALGGGGAALVMGYYGMGGGSSSTSFVLYTWGELGSRFAAEFEIQRARLRAEAEAVSLAEQAEVARARKAFGQHQVAELSELVGSKRGKQLIQAFGPGRVGVYKTLLESLSVACRSEGGSSGGTRFRRAFLAERELAFGKERRKAALVRLAGILGCGVAEIVDNFSVACVRDAEVLEAALWDASIRACPPRKKGKATS